MLSRLAESLYWLGRHLERAENVARMVQVDYHASVESGAVTGVESSTWDALIAATGADDSFDEARAADPNHSPADHLVLARDNPNSIRSTVARARELARTLRPHISREVWEEVNTLHLSLSQRRTVSEHELYDLCVFPHCRSIALLLLALLLLFFLDILFLLLPPSTVLLFPSSFLPLLLRRHFVPSLCSLGSSYPLDSPSSLASHFSLGLACFLSYRDIATPLGNVQGGDVT